MTSRQIALILVGLLVALVMVAVAVISRRQSQIGEQLEALRAAGDPAFIIDMERKDIAPHTNAAHAISAVSEEAARLYSALPPNAGDFDWRVGLSNDEIAKFSASFALYPSVMRALDEAAQCTSYAWPIDYSLQWGPFMTALIEDFQQPRTIGRIFVARARYLAAIDQPDQAVQTLLTHFRLCRLQDREPLLVSFLVNVGCRSMSLSAVTGILQNFELRPETYAAIETELALHDALEGFVDVLKSERAFGNETFNSLPQYVLLTGDWNNYLQVMQQQIEMGAKSHYELVDVERIPAQAMTASALNAIDAAREAMNRTRALIRCLRILNASLANHLTNTQISLSDLELPTVATTDPYNGHPLLMKSTADGWLIYSVGKDLRDNGGQVQDFTDVGVAPPPANVN